MKYLTEPEEKKLLRTARDTKGKKAERDYMILFLGFNTGLRLNEMICLNVGDVRGKERLFVRPETTKKTRNALCVMRDGSTAKTQKVAVGRTVPLSKALQQAMRKFMSLKLQWREGIQDDAPLFVSKKGGRLSRRALQEMFEEWCIKTGLTAPSPLPHPPTGSPLSIRERAGVRGCYTVHSMRHSFAKRLLQRGVALPTVQKLLGHSSLASTGVYTEAGIEEMEEAVAAL